MRFINSLTYKTDSNHKSYLVKLTPKKHMFKINKLYFFFHPSHNKKPK